MALRGFILWFTGVPSATRTAIANVTADELKRRGCKIETLDGQTLTAVLICSLRDQTGNDDAYIRHLRLVCESGIRDGAIVSAANDSKTFEMPEDPRRNLQAAIAVEIGVPKHEVTDDESCNAAGGDSVYEHLNFTKVVVQTGATPDQCLTDILSKLEDLELIARPASKDESYDEEDEAVIRRRLEGLGYL